MLANLPAPGPSARGPSCDRRPSTSTCRYSYSCARTFALLLLVSFALTTGCGVFGSEVPIAAPPGEDGLGTGQRPLERERDDLGRSGRDATDDAAAGRDSSASPSVPEPDPTCGPDARPCAPLYVDEDGDGYGAPGSPVCLCEPDPLSGHVTPFSGDCDDLFGSVHPHAVERCDGVDNDCDGHTDEDFQLNTECGAGACAGGLSVCSGDGSSLVCSTGPGGPEDRSAEETCNGKDDDCDGVTDEEGVCRR